MTFDPETDPANSPNRQRVKDGYETLRGRGNDRLAERLREAESLRAQLNILGDMREFDPEHDDAQTASRVGIKRVYDALLEAGDEDRAESLRRADTVSRQRKRAREFVVEANLEVRP